MEGEPLPSSDKIINKAEYEALCEKEKIGELSDEEFEKMADYQMNNPYPGKEKVEGSIKKTRALLRLYDCCYDTIKDTIAENN